MTDAPGNLRGLSQVARSVAVATRSALQAEWATVALAMGDAGWLTTAADTREDAPFVRLPVQGLLGAWLRHEQAIFRHDDPALAGLRSSLSEAESSLFTLHGARLVAPVLVEGELAGVIATGPGIAGSIFPVSHLNFLKSLSEMAGPMLGAFTDFSDSQAA